MSDYRQQTADRAANLRSLNKAARSQGVGFGHRGRSQAALDGGADIAVLELKLKRGAVIPVTLAEASTVGAVDVSGPLRQIVQARPEDSHRALHEMGQSLKAQYRDACVGRFVSAADDIDPVLVKTFAEIMEDGA